MVVGSSTRDRTAPRGSAALGHRTEPPAARKRAAEGRTRDGASTCQPPNRAARGLRKEQRGRASRPTRPSAPTCGAARSSRPMKPAGRSAAIRTGSGPLRPPTRRPTRSSTAGASPKPHGCSAPTMRACCSARAGRTVSDQELAVARGLYVNRLAALLDRRPSRLADARRFAAHLTTEFDAAGTGARCPPRLSIRSATLTR